jgi:hypothetical protein
MENVNLRIETPGEYIIREGNAKDVQYAKPIVINGVLDAPGQYLNGKKISDESSHIRIYNQQGVIELYVNDTDPNSMHVIKGSLTPSKDLAEFYINNQTHRWDVSGFLRFVKQRRYFFANKEQHTKLIGNMQSWNAKIETTLAQANDQKGNSNFQVEQRVRAVEGFIDRFELLIPIFQGDAPQKFTVEIGLDPKNTSVALYLFSDELFELEVVRRDALMKAALDGMRDYTFSKVVVS